MYFAGPSSKRILRLRHKFLWPARTMVGEQLVLVLHPRTGKNLTKPW